MQITSWMDEAAGKHAEITFTVEQIWYCVNAAVLGFAMLLLIASAVLTFLPGLEGFVYAGKTVSAQAVAAPMRCAVAGLLVARVISGALLKRHMLKK